MLKIFIQSKGRYDAISTHKYLPDGAYKIVVHNDKEKRMYLRNKTVPPESLVVSDVPYNLALQRSWIKDNLVKNSDRWFILMDDNIHGFAAVPKKFYSMEELPILTAKYKTIVERKSVGYDQIEHLVVDTVKLADKMGTGFVGFAKGMNYFFRRKKYKTIAIICNKFCAVRNDELRWPKELNFQNDCTYTALALEKYGKVLMNSYIYPIAEHNEPGGLGTFGERAPEVARCAKILMKRYPGLFQFKQFKKEWLRGSETLEDKYFNTTILKLRITSEKAYDRWRDKNVNRDR